MMYPTPWTVEHLSYVGTTDDSHGNQIDTWAAPVTRAVYGWSAPQYVEPFIPGVQYVGVSLSIYAPSNFTVDDRDRFVVDGKTYEITGETEDYDHGPFGFDPGMVINCTRAE